MAITTVRPNSQDKQWNISTTGAVAANVVTSDNNNATVVTGVITKAYTWLGVPSVTVSSSVRVYGATIRVNASADGVDPTRPEVMSVALRDPANGRASGALTLYKQSTTVVQTAGPQLITPPVGGPWDQATIDRINVTLFWVMSNGGGFGRIAEVFLDWETNTQPTVSAVTVTGAATTTRPTFTWTYADTEGDPQSSWYARAFTSAQYGAAGFNPDSSTPAWDSGVQAGAAETGTVTVDLQNNTTYKIYVWAAQGWPPTQGLGNRWYSVGVASSAFTVAVTPPPTPTIAVTQELTVPRYANRVVASLAGLNLLSSDSASFETSIGDWVNDSNTTLAVSATNPKSGSQAAQLTAIAAANMVIRSGSAATAKRVRPGGSYAATASYRTAVTARTVSTGIRWLDVAGAAIGADTYGTGVADTAAGYTTATVTGTAPANAFSALVLARVASAAIAEVHRVDEAALLIGTGTTWTPGGYIPGSVVFEGVQRISDTITRGRTPSLMHPQIASSGALTTTTDGFTARQATDSVLFRQLDRSPPEAPVNTTTGMIEWQIRAGAGSYLDIGAPDGVATDGQHPYLIPVVPGRAVTGAVWLWASAAVSIRLVLYTVDNVNTAIGLDFSGVIALTTTPQKVTVSGTPAAGCVWGRLAVEDNSSTANVSVFATMPRARASADADEAWPGQVFAFTRYVLRNGTVTIPADGSDTATCVDHEAPPGRYVLYNAYTVASTTGGQSIASPRSTPVPVYMAPPTLPLLKATFAPGTENAIVIYRAPGDTSGPDEDAEELHPAGRNKDPVVSSNWVSGERGSLTLHLLDDESWYRYQQLIPGARALLIQWPEGGQMYVRVTSQQVTHVRGTYRQAAISYTQQARPA